MNLEQHNIQNSVLLNQQLQTKNETTINQITNTIISNIDSSNNNSNSKNNSKKNSFVNISSNNNASLQQQKQAELECEYSICAMFSICYPIIKNFEIFSIDNNDEQQQQLNTANNAISKDTEQQQQPNKSFIPKLLNPLSWGDLTESESLYSSYPSSSIYSLSDIEDDNNNNNNNEVKKPYSNKSKCGKSIKKLFIGGINFDDILGDESLKQLRIQKLIHLFQSFGSVIKTTFYWDKGYFFISYSSNKISQTVVESFSTCKKRQKYIDKIKESLIKESQDARATPQLNFYVGFPNNRNKK